MHHLVVDRTIPLVELIEWLAGFGADLVIEFVDRDDPMVQHLLRPGRSGRRVVRGRHGGGVGELFRSCHEGHVGVRHAGPVSRQDRARVGGDRIRMPGRVKDG